MLHRVILGSVDRFLGVLIEHFAGAFPLWIAPVQIKVMNISAGSIDYAEQIAKQLMLLGYRVEKDFRNEKIGFKVREAQGEKIPHMVIVGDGEMADKTISVRLRDNTLKNNLAFDEYISILNNLVNSKSLELWGTER